MTMLMKGFKYVLPCQYRFSRQSTNELVAEQYRNLVVTIKSCLNDYRIPTNDERSKQAFHALQLLVEGSYSKSIPKRLAIRARQEQRIIRSIRQLLSKRPDIMIRRTDKSKVFYIGKAIDFERKAQEYMLKTNAYEEIRDGRCPLANHLQAVQTLLNQFVSRNILTIQLRNRLLPNLRTLELGHYHGLPKPHKPGTPLRPIVASMNGPTTLISKFLNNLLAPIFFQVAEQTTFVNSIDVVRKLDIYVQQDKLQSTTNFITIDVTDLYTMIPRDGALNTLARFCMKHSKNNHIGTLTVDSIMKIARLILDTNSFVYNRQYYRQIRGGAMGSAFTQVLANIYMLEWEQDLIQYQSTHHEIYGRYIDDIFMTTNASINEMKQRLDRANQRDANIKINYQIATSVNFLDISIRNNNGRLRTSLYHKPSAEPYILPYTSNHPRHIHRNIPYAALLHATRICSDIEDFIRECIRLDIALLLNDYPPVFIRKIFTQFFNACNGLSVYDKLDVEKYTHLHQILLYRPTRSENRRSTMTTQDPVASPAVLQTKPWDRTIMYPRYLFDSSTTAAFSKQFYNWWHKYYANELIQLQNVKVRLVADTQRTLETYLIRKKPPKEILAKLEKP